MDRINIHVRKLYSDEIKRVTSVEDRDLSEYFWANTNRLVYTSDKVGNENFHLFAVNKDGTNEGIIVRSNDSEIVGARDGEKAE